MSRYGALLRNPHFFKFMLSNVLLELGKKLSWVALSWFVYQITGSSLLVGSLLDRYDRRTLLVAENLLRGVILALIPLLHGLEGLTLPVVVAVVFVNGLLSSFTTVGAQAILPSCVAKEELEVANAFSSMTSQAGYLLGPAIGGFCTAAVGAPVTFLLNVACFFAAAGLFARIPDAVWQNGVTRRTGRVTFGENLRRLGVETRQGVQFLLKHRSLLVVALVTFLFNVVYGPLEPMLPLYADEVLGSGPEVIGSMWSFFAVGSFLGSMLWIRWNRTFPYSHALGGVIVLWGAAAGMACVGLGGIVMLHPALRFRDVKALAVTE